MIKKPKVLFIVGPTAAGKTDIGIEIAKRAAGEIISADSMQIYKEIHIGTARPLKEEQQGILHHLMGFVTPDAEYNVAKYQKDAKKAIHKILEKRNLPIVVGGTGLYVNALLYNINFSKPPNLMLRKELENEYDNLGADALHKRLSLLDPDAALRIHANDKKRIVRRLEVLAEGEREAYDFRAEKEEAYDALLVGITKERTSLYEKINARVDVMIEKGLEKEVRALYEKYGSEIAVFAAIGYKEFLPYFADEASLTDTITLIKRNTRRFAKRQFTWFHREEDILWFDTDLQSKKSIVDQILLQLQ